MTTTMLLRRRRRGPTQGTRPHDVRQRDHQRHDHARCARRLPFGGVGASGMGAYHGVEGFRTLSHAKGIFEQGHWNVIELLRAPFGSRADTLLKFFLR